MPVDCFPEGARGGGARGEQRFIKKEILIREKGGGKSDYFKKRLPAREIQGRKLRKIKTWDSLRLWKEV